MKDKQPYEQGPITVLTPELMEGYVKGTLPPQIRQQVKEFLDEHPFEAEAIEGLKYQSVDLTDELQDLEGRLSEKLRAEDNRFRFSWPVAAAISLLAVSGVLFYFLMPGPTDKVAINQKTTEVKKNEQLEAVPLADNTAPAPVSKIKKDAEIIEVPDEEEIEEEIEVNLDVETSETEITQIRDEEEFDPSLEEVYEAENLDFDTNPPAATRIETTGPNTNNTIEEQVLTLQNNVAVDDYHQGLESRSKAKKATALTADEPLARNYTRSDELPIAEAPGDLKEYLKKHTRYQQAAKANGVEGSVVITFTVNEAGALEDFEVIKKLGFGCDEEAIRTIREGPSWKPAEINGIPVKSRGRIEVVFPPQNN